MFGLITNLAKAAVATVVVPIDVVVDIVTLPSTAESSQKPFQQTAKRLGQIGDAIDRAVEGE